MASLPSIVTANLNCSYSAANDSLHCSLSKLPTIKSISSQSTGTLSQMYQIFLTKCDIFKPMLQIRNLISNTANANIISLLETFKYPIRLKQLKQLKVFKSIHFLCYIIHLDILPSELMPPRSCVRSECIMLLCASQLPHLSSAEKFHDGSVHTTSSPRFKFLWKSSNRNYSIPGTLLGRLNSWELY